MKTKEQLNELDEQEKNKVEIFKDKYLKESKNGKQLMKDYSTYKLYHAMDELKKSPVVSIDDLKLIAYEYKELQNKRPQILKMIKETINKKQ